MTWTPPDWHRALAHLAENDVAAAGARTTVGSISELTDDDLTACGTLLTDLELDVACRVRATTDGDTTVLGYPLTEHGPRTGLEKCYRTLARHADNT